MAPPERHFDLEYRESASLEDGTALLLRVVRPEDKAMLVRGLDRLSPRSRYLRFFTNKARLTEPELRYLTEMDGENHFAIGAARIHPDGTEDGIGIARFVRDKDEHEVAEAAIVVVDDFQNQGLGRLLYLRLTAAARERGVRRFRSQVLSENRPMRAIIRDLTPHAQEHASGNIVTVDAEVPEVHPTVSSDTPSARGPHYRLLTLAAEDAVKIKPPASGHEPASKDSDEQDSSG